MCGFASEKGVITSVDPFLHESWPHIVKVTRKELEEEDHEVQIQILELYAIYIAILNCPEFVNLRIITDS